MSFLLDLPIGLAEEGSIRLSDELERERDGSSSMTIVYDSESTTIGWEVDPEASAVAEGSGAEMPLLWLRAEARCARPVEYL